MDNYKKLIVFAYNFPHRKTQDFILRLLIEKIPITCIIAADKVKLNIPPSSIKYKIRHQGFVHPKTIADRFGIRYEVAHHNSESCQLLIDEIKPEIGIIAGARILKSHIIERFPKGIINFHPGDIPGARGLDGLQWSICKDVPLAVTSHIINKQIDSGKVLMKKQLDVYPDDTIFDLSERMYETQLDMIHPSFESLINQSFEEVVDNNSPYNRKMPPDIEQKVLLKVDDYIEKYKTKK